MKSIWDAIAEIAAKVLAGALSEDAGKAEVLALLDAADKVVDKLEDQKING